MRESAPTDSSQSRILAGVPAPARHRRLPQLHGLNTEQGERSPLLEDRIVKIY